MQSPAPAGQAPAARGCGHAALGLPGGPRPQRDAASRLHGRGKGRHRGDGAAGLTHAGWVLLTRPDRFNRLIKQLTLSKTAGAAGVLGNKVRITTTGLLSLLTAFITIT